MKRAKNATNWTGIAAGMAVIVAFSLVCLSCHGAVVDRVDKIVQDVNGAVTGPQGQTAVQVGSIWWPWLTPLSVAITSLCAAWYAYRKGQKNPKTP